MHHYFCSCSEEFSLYTNAYEKYAPDVRCLQCGNDYFKDVNEFESISKTKIWKYFKWDVEYRENSIFWNITFFYEVPILMDTQKVEFQKRNLLKIELLKDGSSPLKITYLSKIVQRYSLFIDSNVKKFKDIMSVEIKEYLYSYIMNNKMNTIEWMKYLLVGNISIDDKLNSISFFLKQKHLQEYQFYFWKMSKIMHFTQTQNSQILMLDVIANHRSQKSIKKALFQAYLTAIESGCYPAYSDYIFSRVIENTDLLVKLYALHPVIKNELFIDETFDIAIVFLDFLKKYYTEKQIINFFTMHIQDTKNYKQRLDLWRDTLRLVNEINRLDTIEEHFFKVKLTTKKLHDEIVRVSHIVSYILDVKEEFTYDEKYLLASLTYKGFTFKLPKTVQELSLWAKTLHNCMLGYKSSIHTNNSIIYGVFQNDELVFALRLKGEDIAEAKGSCNSTVPKNIYKIFKEWQLCNLRRNF